MPPPLGRCSQQALQLRVTGDRGSEALRVTAELQAQLPAQFLAFTADLLEETACQRVIHRAGFKYQADGARHHVRPVGMHVQTANGVEVRQLRRLSLSAQSV